MPHHVPRSFPELLSALAARPTPALTWYGAGGDRVDLSGKVAANWITKAANLLILELSAGPGTTVALELPPHWRALVWAHAAWAAGTEVRLGGGEADVLVRAELSADSPVEKSIETTAPDEILVPLPALARNVEHLPVGAIDGGADLMTQPDGWILPPATDPSAPTGFGLTQAELLAVHIPLRELAPGATPRVLLGPELSLEELLRVVPSLWARGASVVGIGVGGPETAGLLEAEAVTHLLAG